ncbi:FAD binding domain-containing protein [Pimelobacter simplex]|uniref:FAD binding domain-containing protein n=1 Tax=Nocardioides simplex TaxID=2045 RepID=UPI00214FC477|nr:FAD binding domain-containing protein [Pimelobacter simplex]UUW91180.1 FAD binding domain-containing protein [Pimelobacter simplex]UUW95008.1 FAD binding domain-containing protein [Pimelobacter simplex]
MSAPFPVYLPESYDDAAEVLAEHDGEARILAGGQSMAVLLRLGMAQPAGLVSLRRCPEAGTASPTPAGDALRIGARYTVADAHADLSGDFAALRSAAGQVASPHVRNLGSVVGNVCHADPANDLAAPLLCHETTATAQSVRGTRTVSLGDLLVAPYAPALDPDEYVVDLVVAPRTGWHGAYRKQVWRSADHPVAGVAAVLDVRDGVVADARVALSATVAVPCLLDDVAAALRGVAADAAPAVAREAAADALAGLALLGDHDVPASYRRKVAAVLVGDAVADALTTGGGSHR